MGEVKRNDAEGTAAQREPAAPPDPEVPQKARRRKYSAEYKLKILQEADACREPGEIGAVLRREGLYTSHLNTWRRQREEGTLNALKPRKRGRKAKPVNPLARRLAELEQENRALKKRLKQTETVIEIQKKVSEILGIQPLSPQNGESE